MSRVYNFSAGPSCLPEEVLRECAAEMLDYQNSGQSVMEMSHRSKAYKPIITAAEAKIRSLMKVPDNYKILFLRYYLNFPFMILGWVDAHDTCRLPPTRHLSFASRFGNKICI